MACATRTFVIRISSFRFRHARVLFGCSAATLVIHYSRVTIERGAAEMSTKTSVAGSELFIVDNSDDDWKALRYLHDWCQLSERIDVATGYFEVGALLVLKDEWQKVDHIRNVPPFSRDNCGGNAVNNLNTKAYGIIKQTRVSFRTEKLKMGDSLGHSGTGTCCAAENGARNGCAVLRAGERNRRGRRAICRRRRG
jgi:hypothetical protein